MVGEPGCYYRPYTNDVELTLHGERASADMRFSMLEFALGPGLAFMLCRSGTECLVSCRVPRSGLRLTALRESHSQSVCLCDE